MLFFFLQSKLSNVIDLLHSGINRIFRINLIFMLRSFQLVAFSVSVRGVEYVVWDLSLQCVVFPVAGVRVGKVGWFEVPSSLLLRIS